VTKQLMVLIAAEATCDQVYKMIDAPGVDLRCCTHCDLFFDAKVMWPNDTSGNPRCPACKKNNSVIKYKEEHLADMVATEDGYRPCEHCDYAFFMTDAKYLGDGVYVCPNCKKET
jgi:hypothetical protein